MLYNGTNPKNVPPRKANSLRQPLRGHIHVTPSQLPLRLTSSMPRPQEHHLMKAATSIAGTTLLSCPCLSDVYQITAQLEICDGCHQNAMNIIKVLTYCKECLNENLKSNPRSNDHNQKFPAPVNKAVLM